MTMSITKLHFRQLKLNSTDFVEDQATNHGEVLLKDGAITSAKIRDGAVTTAKIGALAVTSGKIATGAIINSKIGSQAVTTDKIANLNVTTAKINDLAITNAKLADDAVSTAKILDEAVTTAKLEDSTSISTGITTAKIADGAITSVKITDANVTSAKIGAGQVLNANIAADTIEIDRFADLAVADEDKLFVGEETSGDVQLGFLENRHFDSSANYANIRKIGAQSADIAMGGNRVTGMKDPINAQDGATKAYVDGVSDSLYWKAPVLRASSSDGGTDALVIDAGSYDSAAGTWTHGSVNTELVLDGSTVGDVLGTRVLYQDASDAQRNGIYELTTQKGAAQEQVWTRVSDADEFDELNGAAVFVLTGTDNADKGYVQTTELTAMTDGQVWVQFSGLGQYAAGTGINIDPLTGVISISSIQLAQIDIKREAPALLEGLVAEAETCLAGTGLDIGSSFNSGMADSSAQLYLNGTLIRLASAANQIGTDGDYFIEAISGTPAHDASGNGVSANMVDGNAKLQVDANLVQEGDRLELRYYNA